MLKEEKHVFTIYSWKWEKRSPSSLDRRSVSLARPGCKQPSIFLVPNYSKFEQEQEILAEMRRRSGKKAFSTTNVQVFSFYRLAWYLLQQTTLLTGNELSESGSAMILRQILEKHEEELTIFRGEINKRGFIRQLQELYSELRIGNIQPEDLMLLFGDSPNAEDQQLKMKDLKLIFSAYDSELTERALSNEDALAILANYMQTQDFTNVKFIVSGFPESMGKSINYCRR